MFTDLAGFTSLLEANAISGSAGAESLLNVLNAYFAEMIEIISKSGGNLLEFTGDAMLVQFPTDQRHSDTARAVRAGLRMQRAMSRFSDLETPQGRFSLGMRIGINTGRVLTADIGTPRRMEHVLLGNAVRATKHAEGSGRVARVCMTENAYQSVANAFRGKAGKPGYVLVTDDFQAEQRIRHRPRQPPACRIHVV
jgi:class 3 adenylate cyclase